MFLPIGDEPNPRRFAWMNWLLILANVAMYMLWTFPLSLQRADPNDPLLPAYMDMLRTIPAAADVLGQLLTNLSAYDLFVFEHGYKAGAPSLDDAFTAMFLHGGFMHLAGNMLFLWIYGDNVEARLGSGRYLLAYLFTGMVGTGLQAFFTPGSMMPIVGASGAISGVLGFYFVYFPHNNIKVFTFLFPFYVGTLRIAARWVLGVYLVFDNILPLFVQVGPSGVAHGAHVGGFVAGLVLSRLVDPLTRTRAPG